MMTWVSERSGNASKGVESVACTPQAASSAVAISTRRRFWIDQRMSAASMSVAPVRWVCACQIIKRATQIGFRINQELSRPDDVLSEGKTLQNLRAAALFSADAHRRGSEVRGIVRHNDDAASTGL